MKYLIIIITLLMLSSCDLFFTSELPFMPKNERQIEEWIFDNIQPKEDNSYDEWQSPDETLNLRTGDCEDYCILFMYLCNEYFGKSYPMIIFRKPNSNSLHATVKYSEGFFFYDKIYSIKKTIIPYIEVMFMTYLK